MNPDIKQLHDELREFEKTPECLDIHLRLSLAEIVIRNMKLKGWSVKRLSRESGVASKLIAAILHSDRSVSTFIASRLLFTLGVSAKFVEEPLPAAGGSDEP